MPSLNEETKTEIKTEDFIPSDIKTPTALKPETFFFDENNLAEDEDEDEDELNEEEERWFEYEEDFYMKLPRKFISSGFKRPETTLRVETRRKYQHFRIERKEKRRKNEKFIYDYVTPPTTSSSSSSSLTHVIDNHVTSSSSSVPPNTNATNSNPTPSNPPPTSSGSNPDTSEAKYLSIKEENEYQEALRQTSVELAPATGLSLQQILDMCNRDLTPEDYDLLLRLDESLAKKNRKTRNFIHIIGKNNFRSRRNPRNLHCLYV